MEIQGRMLRFSCRVVRYAARISKRGPIAFRLSMQLVDAGTSAGANIEEADAGQTKPDFIAKTSLALKETKESRFWLRLILETIVRDDEGVAL